MPAITFKCCKHLIHTKGIFTQCTLKSCVGMYPYWERGKMYTEGGNPRDVQFCNLRGRLNFKSACMGDDGGECSDYAWEERTVVTED